VINSLAKLRQLKHGWDSYGGLPPTPEAIAVAEILLQPGSLVPSPDGGLQIEWHQGGYDIEITIDPRGSITVFAERLPVPAPPNAPPATVVAKP
jgi:hypothetical protein